MPSLVRSIDNPAELLEIGAVSVSGDLMRQVCAITGSRHHIGGQQGLIESLLVRWLLSLPDQGKCPSVSRGAVIEAARRDRGIVY